MSGASELVLALLMAAVFGWPYLVGAQLLLLLARFLLPLRLPWWVVLSPIEIAALPLAAIGVLQLAGQVLGG